MPVNKRMTTIETVNNLLSKGYGKGEGKDYKPYLDVIRVASKGRVSRVKGWKTDRVHHFLSDSETRFFYLLEYANGVTDIREHFPLIDNVDEWITTLDDQLIKRLFNQKTGEPMVLTTTFLLTERNFDGGVKYSARSIKDYRQLENSQVIDRFEVMRRYWELKGIDYGIVTNRDIPVAIAKNIEFVHSSYHLGEYGIEEKEQAFLRDCLLNVLREFKNKSVKEALSKFDNQLGLDGGTGLLIFKHVIARKIVKVEMTKPIDLEMPCSNIYIVSGKEEFHDFHQHVNSI